MVKCGNSRKSTHLPHWHTCKVLRPWALFHETTVSEKLAQWCQIGGSWFVTRYTTHGYIFARLWYWSISLEIKIYQWLQITQSIYEHSTRWIRGKQRQSLKSKLSPMTWSASTKQTMLWTHFLYMSLMYIVASFPDSLLLIPRLSPPRRREPGTRLRLMKGGLHSNPCHLAPL